MAQKYELDGADKIRQIDLINKYYDNEIENYRNFDLEENVKKDSSPAAIVTRSNNKKEEYLRKYDDDTNCDDSTTKSSETASNSDLESLKNEIDSIMMTENVHKFKNDEIILNNIKINQGNVHHKILQNGISNQDISDDDIMSGYTSPAITHIEKVAIQSSSDIQFGNKTYINGPTTVIYLPLDKKESVDEKNNKFQKGKVNEGFEGSHNSDDEFKLSSNLNEVKLDTRTTRFRNYSVILIAAILLLLLTLGIILIIKFQSQENGNSSSISIVESDDDRPESPSNSTIGKDHLPGDVFRTIPRSKWLAQPPNAPLTKLVLPVGRVIIIHTATETCDTQASCIFNVRTIQNYHMESYHFDDIGYNFLIGGDGAVYEGRGWDLQGAHTLGYNKGSIGIAYIGTFINILPSEKQLKAGFLLMQKGVELGKLTKDYKIFAHRQLAAFESPGAKFFELIKTWDHWSKEI